MSFVKVQPGQRLKIPAGDWNAAMDAAKAHAMGGQGLERHDLTGLERTTVRVKNTTQSDWQRGQAVSLSPRVLITDKSIDAGRAIEAITPEADDAGPWAILTGAVRAGQTGLAFVMGVGFAIVNVSDAGHEHAQVPDAGGGTLESTEEPGPIHILAREAGTGEVGALVMLVGRHDLAPDSGGGGGDSTALAICDTFVVSDGSEEVLSEADNRGREFDAALFDLASPATWTPREWVPVECGEDTAIVVGTITVDSVQVDVIVDGTDGGKLKIIGTGGTAEVEVKLVLAASCGHCPEGCLCQGVEDVDWLALVNEEVESCNGLVRQYDVTLTITVERRDTNCAGAAIESETATDTVRVTAIEDTACHWTAEWTPDLGDFDASDLSLSADANGFYVSSPNITNTDMGPGNVDASATKRSSGITGNYASDGYECQVQFTDALAAKITAVSVAEVA